MDYNSIARRILDDIAFATLATVTSEGEPWNTPVFCAHGGSNIYWASHPNSVHSQNIAATGKVFIAIYNSQAGEGEGVGLYMQASAHVLTDRSEIERALDLLGKRRGKPFEHIEKFLEDGPQRIYVAKPSHVWINDAARDTDGDFIKDFRREVTL